MNDIAPAGIGDNTAAVPLAEILQDETASYRERRDALLDSLKNSRITDQATAEAVTTLGGLLKNLRDTVEADRKVRVKPIDDQKAAIQKAFKADIIDALDSAMTTCRRMLDAYRAQLEQQARAEQRKRDEEAAAARREAEEAARLKAEAEAKGDTGAALQAEIAEIQARDRAEATAAAEGIRPDAMIRTQAATAGTTTVVTGKIDNIGQFLAWLIRNDAKWLSEALQPRADRLLRTGMTPDGVSRVETKSTRIGR